MALYCSFMQFNRPALLQVGKTLLHISKPAPRHSSTICVSFMRCLSIIFPFMLALLFGRRHLLPSKKSLRTGGKAIAWLLSSMVMVMAMLWLLDYFYSVGGLLKMMMIIIKWCVHCNLVIYSLSSVPAPIVWLVQYKRTHREPSDHNHHHYQLPSSFLQAWYHRIFISESKL